MALIVKRRRRFESNKTSGRNVNDCSLQCRENIFSAAGKQDGWVTYGWRGHFSYCNMQAYSAAFIIYIKFAPEWEEVHQIFIHSVGKKPFVSVKWQNSISTIRRYPESHAFGPHRHKNWFRSLDVRDNGDGSNRVLRNVGNSARLQGVARQLIEIRVVAFTKN